MTLNNLNIQDQLACNDHHIDDRNYDFGSTPEQDRMKDEKEGYEYQAWKESDYSQFSGFCYIKDQRDIDNKLEGLHIHAIFNHAGGFNHPDFGASILTEFGIPTSSYYVFAEDLLDRIEHITTFNGQPDETLKALLKLTQYTDQNNKRLAAIKESYHNQNSNNPTLK